MKHIRRPIEATTLELIDAVAFAEAFQQLVYLVVYLVVVGIVFGVRNHRQKKAGTFDSVATLPLGEQLIRIFELVLGVTPCLVWSLWYSEIIFLSSYMWLCLFLEMTPQPQGPDIIRWVVVMIFCVNFVRDMIHVKHSHLKSSKPGRLVEPVKERIITERVLIVCPYCATKNEQGIIKCRKCGAEV